MATKTTAGHGLGWNPQRGDIRDLRYTAPPPTALPAAYDPRKRWFAPDNQGMLGSCTAFCLGAAFRWARQKHYGWHDTASPGTHIGGMEDYTISYLFQYYNSRALEGTTSIDNGATIRDAAKTLAQFGAPAWHNWTYDDITAGPTPKFAQRPPQSVYDNASHHDVVQYYALAQDLQTIKACLASDWPVACGITVYPSFEGQDVGITGNVPMPSMGESAIGGHAQLLIGFEDATQRFISRNSWGAWGDAGHLHIPYSYILSPDLASDFWTIRTVGA